MSDHFLNELDPPRVVALDDTDAEALAAAGVVTVHRLVNGQWEMTPGSKVGIARVGSATVWIRPKVTIDRILFLLGFARDPGWQQPDVELDEVDQLLPVLATAYAAQAEKAIEQGLLQGYVEVDDQLTVLRGRLREQEQLRRRFGLAVPLLVRFDDHTVDIPENQLLRGATDVLLRLPGISSKTRTRLLGVRQILGEVAPLPAGARPPAWRPSRLNRRYQVALWLAELLLAGNSLDQSPGSTRVSGFLVDMAKVFEDFVTRTLTDALDVHGGHCRAQDPHYLDVAAEVRMKPDLVWYVGGQPAAVIDAKYKAEKPAGFPDADLYQMLAYCTALDLRDGDLVYARGNEPETTHEIRNVAVSIRVHALDLSQPPSGIIGQVRSVASRIAAARDQVLA